MKNWKRAVAALSFAALLLSGCQNADPTQAPTDPPTAPPTQAPTAAPTAAPTEAPVKTGWYEEAGKRYYYDENGKQYLGWLNTDQGTYYLDFDGAAATGWLDIGDHTYYFSDTGIMHTGWLTEDGHTYYFLINGVMTQGWNQINGKQYYFSGDGVMHTGWLYRNDQAYYFLPDGTGAVGAVEIDGQTYYFNPAGVNVILVNPWNSLPEDYFTEVVEVEDMDISVACVDALRAMLAACRDAGCEPVLISGYRTWDTQNGLYQNNIQKYLNRGYDYDTAVELAGRSVAIPGTSEHQLGLAVDIVDNYNWNLDESQEDTETQQWLMEHCWEYGFILRYPNGTTDITGIIYEPWHYRYVGVQIALELRDLGITLEEYLGAA